MIINYYSNLISEQLFKNLYKNNKPGVQVQVFNGLIVDGLIKNGCDVTCLSVIPVSKSLINSNYISIKDELYFKYYKIFNVPILKDITILISSFIGTLINLTHKKDLVCVGDVLSVSNCLGASLACKILNRQFIGIVTDIPDLIIQNKLYNFLSNLIIKLSSDFVFLTEPMNTKLNTQNKPYTIIEGSTNFIPSNQLIKRSNSFMYAGSIDKVNGIDVLINSFKDIKTDFELHIYGGGDFEDSLLNICKAHKNIKYFGLISHTEILDKIQSASFLINPRGTKNEMVKYSFPSKNMEYLASGTPFLCTKLPCIPQEYFQYLNVFETDDVEGLKKGIEKVLDEDYDLLLDKALKGQKFVLDNKNNVAQTKKLISLIKEQ